MQEENISLKILGELGTHSMDKVGKSDITLLLPLYIHIHPFNVQV
jgi:hypothetical protein